MGCDWNKKLRKSLQNPLPTTQLMAQYVLYKYSTWIPEACRPVSQEFCAHFAKSVNFTFNRQRQKTPYFLNKPVSEQNSVIQPNGKYIIREGVGVQINENSRGGNSWKGGRWFHNMKEWSNRSPMIYYMKGSENVWKLPSKGQLSLWWSRRDEWQKRKPVLSNPFCRVFKKLRYKGIQLLGA